MHSVVAHLCMSTSVVVVLLYIAILCVSARVCVCVRACVRVWVAMLVPLGSYSHGYTECCSIAVTTYTYS